MYTHMFEKKKLPRGMLKDLSFALVPCRCRARILYKKSTDFNISSSSLPVCVYAYYLSICLSIEQRQEQQCLIVAMGAIKLIRAHC